MAILPDNTDQPTFKEIFYHEPANQLRNFISESNDSHKWSNLTIEIDNNTECIHPMFADIDGDLHNPREGWIPFTVRLDYNKMIERFHLEYDHEMSYQQYFDYVNKPANRLTRHIEYIKIFISEFDALLRCIENFQFIKED